MDLGCEIAVVGGKAPIFFVVVLGMGRLLVVEVELQLVSFPIRSFRMLRRLL